MRLIAISILIFFYTSGFSQDTLYLDLNRAIQVARKNNAQFVNTAITNLEDANVKNSNYFTLPPTEFNYQYGHLYTPENGWKLEVVQEFGNPFYYSRQTKATQAANEIKYNQNELENKGLEIKIKAAYLEWIYLMNIAENIDALREYLAKSFDVVSVRTALGDIEPLREVQTREWISEIETQYMINKIDIDIAKNNVQKLLNSDKVILPNSKKLELYQVSKYHDTSAYNGRYITDVLLKKYYYSEAIVKTKKAAFTPGVKAGFFIQNIGTYPTMAGIKAGLSIPIWSFLQKTEVRKSKVQSLIDYNLYKQATTTIQFEVENLILQLDKHFLQIRHYQNYVLPSANLLTSTTIAKYQHEEIDYEVYVQKITEALKIKRDYFKLINEYNQTAIQLELYTK